MNAADKGLRASGEFMSALEKTPKCSRNTNLRKELSAKDKNSLKKNKRELKAVDKNRY